VFYWFLKVFALGPILRLFFRPWVEGAENIPREGGAILASNHLSFSDSIFLPLVLERRVTFLVKADYPEGTRSPDGRLFRGRTGVARLALEAKVPVIPVVMVGTDEAQPTGRILPKITRVGIRIGTPLDFSRYEGMEDDRFVLRSATDEILYELMRLSNQEYVDEYASTMKDKLKSISRSRGTVARPLDGGNPDVDRAAS